MTRTEYIAKLTKEYLRITTGHEEAIEYFMGIFWRELDTENEIRNPDWVHPKEAAHEVIDVF